MRKCQVVEGFRDLKVILPEVFFFYLESSFEEASSGQPSVGVGEVGQRNRSKCEVFFFILTARSRRSFFML